MLFTIYTIGFILFFPIFVVKAHGTNPIDNTFSGRLASLVAGLITAAAWPWWLIDRLVWKLK